MCLHFKRYSSLDEKKRAVTPRESPKLDEELPPKPGQNPERDVIELGIRDSITLKGSCALSVGVNAAIFLVYITMIKFLISLNKPRETLQKWVQINQSGANVDADTPSKSLTLSVYRPYILYFDSVVHGLPYQGFAIKLTML